MPRFDGNGPGGQGPGRGRGRGYCRTDNGTGNDGRGGFGAGRGQGRGMGRGCGSRMGGYQTPSGNPVPYGDVPPAAAYPHPQEEIQELNAQARMLTQELEAIRQRMAALEKSGR